MSTNLFSPAILLAAVICSTSMSADAVVTILEDDFDTGASLSNYTVAQTGSTAASVEGGQLRLDINSNFGHHILLQNMSFIGREYSPTIANNSGLVTWEINVSNMDGAFNNGFEFVLLSTRSDPYEIGAVGYSLTGGGLPGSSMILKRFDFGLGGGSESLVGVSRFSGLDPLPEQGSFRITYNPSNDEWHLYGEFGPSYIAPSSVSTLLGSRIDGTYTSENTPYLGLSARTSGSVLFDNLRVTVVPEPSSLLLAVVGFAAVAFRRRVR